jgi:hypothetical protein
MSDHDRMGAALARALEHTDRSPEAVAAILDVATLSALSFVEKVRQTLLTFASSADLGEKERVAVARLAEAFDMTGFSESIEVGRDHH